jgi:rhodanese-related sulfurtransferase
VVQQGFFGWKGWLVGLCLLTQLAAQAMTLERVGDTLYATGEVGDDFPSFKEQLGRPGLRRLVLVDSPGGSLWTALTVGSAVREAGLDTVAVGSCLSACAVLFVAGKTRSFGTGRSPGGTLLGIHGGYNPDSGRLGFGVGPALYAFFRRQIGDAMNDGVINEAIYGLKDPRGFLVLREIGRLPAQASTASLCQNAYQPTTCKEYEGKDAFTLGLLTQRETVLVDLPASMQLQIKHFGQVVKDTPFDLAAWAQEVRAVMCTKGNCPELDKFLKSYSMAPLHKAIAWDEGISGRTVSRLHIAFMANDPQQAATQALLGCNQFEGKPRLCRVLTQDDQDLRPLSERQRQQTREALAQLPPALPAALADEKADFCSGKASKRKSMEEEAYDAAAPCELQGVVRIDTADLARMLSEVKLPILVDVSSDHGMVPGAFALLGAGVSSGDATQEAAVHQRFEGLIRAASPDPKQPLVFYGGARAGWLSANAALRAVQAGYTRVYWYRGGLPAWTAAGLPTVGKVALGVVY